MNSIENISIVKFNEITLEDVLAYCNNDSWIDGGVAKSRYSSELGGEVNKNIRDAKIAKMPEDFYHNLDKLIDPYIKKYAKDNNINILKRINYVVTKYSKGQFFKEHTDTTKEFPRKISAILYLNDNYTGGTITFTKFNKTFKPNANSLFIFPSSEYFSHSADPVIDGIKYVIVGFWA